VVAPSPRPFLVLLAGPNGSGKTTLYETRIARAFNAPFINADLIQRDELRQVDMDAAYRAARIAEERRRACLTKGQSFATETVFSHPSKLDLIRDAKAVGYRIIVFHVGVDNPDLSVARVAERVGEGGHNVPEEKIRRRYDRNGPLIKQAVLQSDVAHIFDNSGLNMPPVRVLSFVNGHPDYSADRIPTWIMRLYGNVIG